jgi:alpha-tubulin suppressor-like RCC1 family protein
MAKFCNNFKDLFCIITYLALFLNSCSGSYSSSPDAPTFILSRQLAQVSSHLSGQFVVYETSGSVRASQPLQFVEDAEGNTIVTTASVPLKKDNIYRFIVLFKWDEVPIAYVDTIQKTSNTESTTIHFTEDLIIYERSTILSPSESTVLDLDITEGRLPSLDLDNDTYSNFIELRSGSDYQDPNSVPQGPKISDFVASYINSDIGTTNTLPLLQITATLNDGNGISDVSLRFPGAEYLHLVLQEELSGQSLDKQRQYRASLYETHLPYGNLEIVLQATNGLGLVREEKVDIQVDRLEVEPNHDAPFNNEGPIIDFESLSEGQTVGGEVNIAIRAYDRDGVALLELVKPTDVSVKETASDRFVAKWDSELIQDGVVRLVVRAVDSYGMESRRSLDINIFNGRDISGPKILLKAQEKGSMAMIEFERGETVYGTVFLTATSDDATGSSTLSLLSQNISGIEERLNQTPTHYIAELDTTLYEDGDEITLRFLASDILGNESRRTFSLTVGNVPVIKTFSVRGSEHIIADGPGDREFEFVWEAKNANILSLSDVERGENISVGAQDFVLLQTPLNGILIRIEYPGTYRLTAERNSNIEIRDVTIEFDDDRDGVGSVTDNCADDSNPGQEDSDSDGDGDVCDNDDDNDGTEDENDNCVFVSNADQADLDGDNLGDTCDDDKDGDGFTIADGDCQDLLARVHPDNQEVFDGIDNDCNGRIDERMWHSISVGVKHICGIKTDNTISCWGNNEEGQCNAPPDNFLQVSVGSLHTCGLKADNRIVCWGHNGHNQSMVPEALYLQVDSEGHHTCAINSNSQLVCWGRDNFGQSNAPGGFFTKFSSGANHNCAIDDHDTLLCWGQEFGAPPEGNFLQIATGSQHACAISNDEELICWGNNNEGQLEAPEGLFSLVDAKGSSNCALSEGGSIICWGENSSEVSGDQNENFMDLSTNGRTSCAVKADGSLTCWGYPLVMPQGPFQQISGGRAHLCTLNIDNKIMCVGTNTSGQTDSPEGVFIQISSGGSHSCALERDGSIVCWGRNDHGQSSPPEGEFTQIECGDLHSCGLKRDGSIECWGHDLHGQSNAPGGNNFRKVSSGWFHNCAVRTDDSIVCWGHNVFGQSVSPEGQFLEVSAGGLHSCGVRSDLSVLCWGNNDENQLQVPEAQFLNISSSLNHSCGLRQDHSILCWGSDRNGAAEELRGQYRQVSAGGSHSCGLTLNRLLVCRGSLYFDPE